ncbi:uncharacterized protein LOC135359426 [Latimeria chalumnae]|uniref:uncharacterized protein LOC135359426 n=1 Tax=Latimeria chalumnae TaxID=7897 RepID=UPI00313CE7EC
MSENSEALPDDNMKAVNKDEEQTDIINGKKSKQGWPIWGLGNFARFGIWGKDQDLDESSINPTGKEEPKDKGIVLETHEEIKRVTLSNSNINKEKDTDSKEENMDITNKQQAVTGNAKELQEDSEDSYKHNSKSYTGWALVGFGNLLNFRNNENDIESSLTTEISDKSSQHTNNKQEKESLLDQQQYVENNYLTRPSEKVPSEPQSSDQAGGFQHIFSFSRHTGEEKKVQEDDALKNTQEHETERATAAHIDESQSFFSVNHFTNMFNTKLFTSENKEITKIVPEDFNLKEETSEKITCSVKDDTLSDIKINDENKSLEHQTLISEITMPDDNGHSVEETKGKDNMLRESPLPVTLEKNSVKKSKYKVNGMKTENEDHTFSQKVYQSQNLPQYVEVKLNLLRDSLEQTEILPDHPATHQQIIGEANNNQGRNERNLLSNSKAETDITEHKITATKREEYNDQTDVVLSTEPKDLLVSDHNKPFVDQFRENVKKEPSSGFNQTAYKPERSVDSERVTQESSKISLLDNKVPTALSNNKSIIMKDKAVKVCMNSFPHEFMLQCRPLQQQTESLNKNKRTLKDSEGSKKNKRYSSIQINTKHLSKQNPKVGESLKVSSHDKHSHKSEGYLISSPQLNQVSVTVNNTSLLQEKIKGKKDVKYNLKATEKAGQCEYVPIKGFFRGKVLQEQIKMPSETLIQDKTKAQEILLSKPCTSNYYSTLCHKYPKTEVPVDSNSHDILSEEEFCNKKQVQNCAAVFISKPEVCSSTIHSESVKKILNDEMHEKYYFPYSTVNDQLKCYNYAEISSDKSAPQSYYTSQRQVKSNILENQITNKGNPTEDSGRQEKLGSKFTEYQKSLLNKGNIADKTTVLPEKFYNKNDDGMKLELTESKNVAQVLEETKETLLLKEVPKDEKETSKTSVWSISSFFQKSKNYLQILNGNKPVSDSFSGLKILNQQMTVPELMYLEEEFGKSKLLWLEQTLENTGITNNMHEDNLQTLLKFEHNLIQHKQQLLFSKEARSKSSFNEEAFKDHMQVLQNLQSLLSSIKFKCNAQLYSLSDDPGTGRSTVYLITKI